MKNKLSLIFPCAVFITALFICLSIASPVRAQDVPAGGDTETDQNEFFQRPYQMPEWMRHLLAKKDELPADFGDVIVTRQKGLTLKFGDNTLWAGPYSVIRVHGIPDKKAEDKSEPPIPELLFGEFQIFGGGDGGKLYMPGHEVDFTNRVLAYVYEDKSSDLAALSGDVQLISAGAEAPVPLPVGTFVIIEGNGGVGEFEQLSPDDIDYYLSQEVSGEEIKVILNKDELGFLLAELNEFWNEDRINLLVEGAETPEGLTIATGKTIQAEASAVPQENIQAFDANSAQQKSLSFSTSVAVQKSASDIPSITSMTIGSKTVGSGETAALDFSNLEDKTIVFSGKASTSDAEGTWTLSVKINDDETSIDGLKSFSGSIRVVQEFPAMPTAYGVMIGNQPGEMYTGDNSIVTREDLTSGSLVISGMADPGQNVLNYKLEFLAKDKEDNEHSIGTYSVELDLSELATVEVSLDDGIGWNKAKGENAWEYSFRPNDGDKYMVKVRSIDVMDNYSEEQFEAYSFKYSYKTPNELLRDTFDTMLRAILDEDRNTFMRNVSQDFSTSIENLRDYNDLENALDTRFRTGDLSIKYTVNDTNAYLDSGEGYVDFYWSGTGLTSSNSYDNYTFVFEEGQWMLREITDPKTFILLSKEASFIEIEADENTLEADGEDSTDIRATVYDEAGTIVADGVSVTFTSTSGSLFPSSSSTSGGVAETTFTAPTSDGTVTIQASSGQVSDSLTINIEPIAAPLPPD